MAPSLANVSMQEMEDNSPMQAPPKASQLPSKNGSHPKATGGPGKTVQQDAGTFTMPKPPTFDTVEEHRQHILERLALAFRIFARLGFEEHVAGHLTVRDPEHNDRFWVNPFGHPFAHMRVSDLLCIDHDGNVVAGGRPENKIYNTAAFAIHAQIHKARPDANAACHSHSIYGKAFSTLGRNLPITTQDACTFYKACSLYDSFGGVVLADKEGQNIARALGNGKAVILQNHGILTVGETIESATAWFIMLERSCQAVLLSEAAGKPIDVEDEEAEFTYKAVGGEAAGWFSASPYFKVAERESKGEHLE